MTAIAKSRKTHPAAKKSCGCEERAIWQPIFEYVKGPNVILKVQGIKAEMTRYFRLIFIEYCLLDNFATISHQRSFLIQFKMLSKPQLNSTTIQHKLGLTRKWLCKTPPPTTETQYQQYLSCY